MSETCLNRPEINLQYICRICLGDKVVRGMSYEEINWYQNASKANSLPLPSELCVCWMCAHLLRKYIKFLHQCQKGYYLLTQLAQDPKTCLTISEKAHSFVQTEPTTNSIPPDIIESCNSYTNINVKLENFGGALDTNHFADSDDDRAVSDDDLPLMIFKHDGDILKKKNKKKIRLKKTNADKSVSIKERSDIEHVEGGDTNRQTGGQTDKPLSVPREGFSSRMRQETEEYRVIKLTHEQVLEEMRARMDDGRYVRAPYKCASCALGYNFRDVLDSHMRKHTQEHGSFLCGICSQYCPSAVSLRGHIKSHTTRYECKVCGCTRRCRQHLLEHYRAAHAAAAARRYHCDHCPFTTTKRTVMQRHVRTAHGARALSVAAAAAPAQHVCAHAHCARRFKTIDALRVHTSRHDASCAHVCGECGRRFVFASLLKKHQDAVHVRGDYYCVECDTRFGSLYNLQLHFKRSKRHRDASSNVKITS